MSLVYGKPVESWIRENSPENGVFRAYWTKDGEGVSLEDTGYGLRYEWYFKDGKQDGESKGWYPTGQLKSIKNWKNGIQDGLQTEWYENGHKMLIESFKDGRFDGLFTKWHENGQKKWENTYKDGILIDKVIQGE